MAVSPLGQSFAPTSAADEIKKPTPAQQAIQVLSMRLPRVRGAKAISPLLGESRSAAGREVGGFSPESAVLQTLMQTVAPSAPDGAMPGAASPSMGASNPFASAMEALGGGMANAPSAPSPASPFASQPVPFARPENPQMPGLPSGPKPAPVIVPGVDDVDPATRPPVRVPGADAFGQPERVPVLLPERETVDPSPRIPDMDFNDGRAPRGERPPVTLPPADETTYAPPPPRGPQSTRDPDAPIDVVPPPSAGGSTQDFDPRVVQALMEMLRRGGRG